MLSRMFCGGVMLIAMMQGCTVTTGVYVEKDWMIDSHINPDMNTKFKIEATRTFGDTH